MAECDWKPLIAPHLNKPLVMWLLGPLNRTKLYPEEDMLKAQLDVLLQTDWYPQTIDAYKALHHLAANDDLLQNLQQREAEFWSRFWPLHDAATPLIQFY